MSKRKQPEPIPGTKGGFEEWQGSEDEGSSDDEVGNQKERILNRGVMQGAPVAKVLTKKGKKNVYAVITDLGAGLQGFMPISSMAEDPDLRDFLSHKLMHLRTGEAPAPGLPDRRSRISRIVATDQGLHNNQILISAMGRRVCSSMKDDWDNLPVCVSNLLSLLYDRDRVCEITSLANLRIGQVLDGVVQRRTNEGVVASLTTGVSRKNAHPLMGVAVGANAVSTDTTGTTTREIGTPSSAPGTPGGRQQSAPGTLRCRVIDCDPVNGIVDFSCNPAVANCPTALDRRTALSTFKNLAKKMKKTIPAQVILRKENYAIVISRPYSGVLGYLALPESDSERSRVKAGERITAVVEYVRIRPVANTSQPKRAKWVETGRQVQEDHEDLQEKRRTNLMRTPDDPWLCEESFVVLSLQPTAEPKQDVELEKPKAAPKKSDPSDAIEVGFDWQESESEEEDKKEAKKSPTTRPQKKSKKAETEIQIDKVERQRAEGGPAKTTEDFDRLIMASPHSSFVWCQYMAFHMANREFEQSRVIAERALKTISYRETGELHNIWVAYLNLENLNGTTESLNTVFQRFLQHSDDQLSAYKALLDIAKASKHNILAERTYQTILRKFGRSTEPWVNYAQYLLSLGAHDAINKLQKRMLANDQLTSKQQVDVLIKYGRMHYRQGSIDKGRTIFEGLLLKHPKRADLWSVYLDMERVVLPRLEDLTRIRNVFDRVTSLNLSSKKMQQFMTKYLSFEREKGDEERVEYVKKRAQEYVNAKLGVGDEDEE